jgi:hypothetical protein
LVRQSGLRREEERQSRRSHRINSDENNGIDVEDLDSEEFESEELSDYD